MDINNQRSLVDSTDNTGRMPVLFVGHGSPMYAIEQNEFTRYWQKLGETIPRPKAIICISAHWETSGTQVTAKQNPSTIHDFGGFAKELYDIKYPSPGNPELAREIIKTITGTKVQADEKWGLDHGAWSILSRMYPNFDIPVVLLSLDYNKSPKEHYELAKELAAFREKGILIMGSGNMVHNLGKVVWDRADDEEYGLDWAKAANDTLKELILNNKHKELTDYNLLSKEVQMAIPTPDHYLPLLYALALKKENDDISFFNDKMVMGSLSMTSVKIG